MDEERKTARGESDAAERIDGVAASSCGERKTAGELAGSGEASGAARPSTARSASPLPSPSPTPTFSGTNRPARRARRLRWQAGVPASMTALALFSFTLLVGGVAGYVSTIPGLLYEPPVPSLVPLGLAFASTDDAAKLSVVSSDGPSRNVGPVDQQEVAEQNAVSAALGLGAFGGVLGAGRLLRVRRPARLTRRLRRPWRLRRPLRPAPLRMRDRIPAAPLRPGRGRARARLAAGVLARLAAIQRRAAPLQAALRPAGRRKRLRPRVLLKQKKLRSTRCWLII